MMQNCYWQQEQENGSAELKKIADAVCGTVQEDGIYKELVNREIIKER